VLVYSLTGKDNRALTVQEFV
jgi:hypothetical protein